MKIAPTDLDREAARLFNAVPRMRAWFAEPGADARACTVLEVETPANEWTPGDPRLWVAWEGCNGACGWVRAEWLTALDVDDPATVGCMLAQVEAAAGPVVLIWDAWKDGMTHYVVRYLDKWSGPTRGAALVAAKRALAAPETA